MGRALDADGRCLAMSAPIIARGWNSGPYPAGDGRRGMDDGRRLSASRIPLR